MGIWSLMAMAGHGFALLPVSFCVLIISSATPKASLFLRIIAAHWRYSWMLFAQFSERYFSFLSK